jgi:hypothetical protein
MKAPKILTLLILFFIVNQICFAQGSQALDFITYPNSIQSFGMGGNSVALFNSNDAMTFNPANLIYAEGAEISFFRQPFQLIIDAPISNYTATFKYKNYGVFSFEYRNQDFGEFVTTTAVSPEPTGIKRLYYNNFGVGYARPICENLFAGATLKYSYWYFGENIRSFDFTES